MKQRWWARFTPTGKRMTIFLIGLLIVDLFLLAYLNRKPICIEATLLSEMEWVEANGQSSFVYSCEANVETRFSKVFFEKLAEIQRRIVPFERLLKGHFKPIHPIRLVIHEGPSDQLKVSSDVIVMNQSLFFERSWLLEKAFVKAWLQQFQKGHGLGLLRLEVLTHLLVWNLGIREKVMQSWEPLLGQWPQFATSWSGYCQSPVRDIAYLPLCMSPSLTKNAEAFTPFSTNFWLGQKLWQSFQVLSVAEQLEFFKKIDRLVETLSDSEELPLSEMSLTELDGYSRSEADVWRHALEQIGFRDWGWNFVSKVTGDLDAYSNSLARADLYIQKNTAWTSEELLQLQQFALEETDYRLVAENDEGLWTFPWLTPVKSEALPYLKTQNLILVTCRLPTVEELLENQKRSDKIIVVQTCDENPPALIYSGLLHRGLQFFSLDNKDAKFVVINLEALRFLVDRDSSLLKKSLFFDLQVPEKKNNLAQWAGWTSALWNSKYRAYEVQATIDVVEWFKLPENVWPDFKL